MQHKFYPRDKNYILREAQISSQEELLSILINELIYSYQAHYNSLGLFDPIQEKVNNPENYQKEQLNYFYDILAGTYRYLYGDNQLELLFDGGTHFEKYTKIWQMEFIKWVMDLCKDKNFSKALLDITLFFPKAYNQESATNRLRKHYCTHFNLKIRKLYAKEGYKIAI